MMLRRSLHPNRRGKDGQRHREIAYFLVHAPVVSTVSEIIARAGGRWQIEEDNEINKQLVGFAQYQVRKWTQAKTGEATVPGRTTLAVQEACCRMRCTMAWCTESCERRFHNCRSIRRQFRVVQDGQQERRCA
jgi:hypothetical protein